MDEINRIKKDIESKMKYKKDTKRLTQYKEIKVEFQNGSYGYDDLIGGPQGHIFSCLSS